MALYKSLFFLFGILSSSLAFKITKNETKIEDNTLMLTCIADSDYDWCLFKQNNKRCEFQWSYDAKNVTTKNCKDFEDRLKFVGSSNECAIEIHDKTDEGLHINLFDK